MDEHVHLKINMKCLLALGVYQVKLKNWFASFLYRHVYSKIPMGYLICFVLSECMEIATSFDCGVFYLAQIFGITLLYTVTIWKVLVCKGSKVHKLVDQIKDTEKRIFSYKNKDLEEMYYKHVRWNYSANKLFICAGIITVLPFYIGPIVEQMSTDYVKEYDEDGYEKRPLPFTTWFPFNRYKYYYVSYAYHILAATIGCSLTVSADLLFVGLMTFAIGQMKILQYSFRNSKEIAMNLVKNTGMSLDDAIVIAIRYFIRMHKIIIRYLEILDSAMRIVMFYYFMISSMQMAMLGLQILSVDFGWQQCSIVEHLFVIFIQLFMFYWHANEIILESRGISSAIWDSDWIEYNNSVKRSLIIVMMRAQKPLTLSIGPFYVMSNETALSVLRAAYSYVAIIRQMYMRK